MEMKTLKHMLTILAAFGNMAAQNVPALTLNSGAVMPQFGIGTYNQTNDQAYAGVLYALQHGYRHIDTAHAYGDEEGVGRAIKDSDVPDAYQGLPHGFGLGTCTVAEGWIDEAVKFWETNTKKR